VVERIRKKFSNAIQHHKSLLIFAEYVKELVVNLLRFLFLSRTIFLSSTELKLLEHYFCSKKPNGERIEVVDFVLQ